jgi:hypothetical protein
MSADDFADHTTFLRYVEPAAAMLSDLVAAGHLVSRAGHSGGRLIPAAESDAMAELALQADYAGAWDATPIDTAMGHVGLLLAAGEDAVRTFASIIVREPTPLYSYVPLARAALECFALAHWLSEPGIGIKERVRRSLNERVESAYEQSRLPAELSPEPARQDRLLSATSLGYERTKPRKGRPVFLAPGPPTVTRRIRNVLGGDELGQIMYSYASAISHGAMWGLVARVHRPKNAVGPVVTVPLVTSADDLTTHAIVLALAHVTVYTGFVRHMGWELPAWNRAMLGAMAFARDNLAVRDALP